MAIGEEVHIHMHNSNNNYLKTIDRPAFNNNNSLLIALQTEAPSSRVPFADTRVELGKV